MHFELIKNKVYVKFFDKTFKYSSSIYNADNYQDSVKKLEVRQNIENIKKDLKVKKILLLKQVHGNFIVDADNISLDEKPEADGSVTTKSDLALSILTADCVPVLLSSGDGHIIGAAHCGWRSAKLDIIKNISAFMQKNGAKNITAAIGPAIAQNSYEVDALYRQNFIDEAKENENFFIDSQRKNFFMFDLVSFVKKKLNQQNIEVVFDINEDTYALKEKYPSYRRDCHQGGVYSQNILSAIFIIRRDDN